MNTIDLGHYRFLMSPYKRLTATEGECPFPCVGTIYNVEVKEWEHGGSGHSLQISLDNLAISTEVQQLSCDITCIIGEFGGNLGFFLGGSLLFGFNAIAKYFSRALENMYMTWQNRN